MAKFALFCVLFTVSFAGYSQVTFKIKRGCDSAIIVNAINGVWQEEADTLHTYNFTLLPGVRWGVHGLKWFEKGWNHKDRKAKLSSVWFIQMVNIDTIPIQNQTACHKRIQDSANVCYFELAICNIAGNPITQLCALHNNGKELIMNVDNPSLIAYGYGVPVITAWKKKE